MAVPDRVHLLSKDLCFILTVLFSEVGFSISFNLDVQFPVIKDGKTEGSLFGLSVALHKQTEGATTKCLLLTGAPKERAQPRFRANETGAVYSCPISLDPSDCSRLDLLEPEKPDEILDGMWLGVTVARQRDQWGGRVLACGHRYIRRIGPDYSVLRMIGKCYVRGNDLSYDPNDYWQRDPYENCSPDEDHMMEGACNLGISGGIAQTDVFLGSPGSYNWQGNVHVTWWNPDPNEAWEDRDKQFQNFKTKSNSYMGYSVAEEKGLLSAEEFTLVTGSPRQDSRGVVTLAKIEFNTLVPMLILIGEQVGAYFGNSIATTDLNSDGWSDLVVGAPFYFDRKEERGGAVYVYMNENGSFRNDSSMTLFGFAGSAFGMSVAAIGDLNQDGFQDIAVGAPYEGTGKVFIWMGGQNGIAQEHSQMIEGRDVRNGGFRTFGYSINGGIDVDQNQYPDVLVGSLDNRIALLRARPVIHLDKTLTVKPTLVDPSHCSKGSCVTAQVCFSYTLSNGDKDFNDNITVKYTVEADRARRSSRLRFLDNRQDVFTGFLSMPSSRCRELKLSLVEPLRDKLQPVIFSLNVSLYERKPRFKRTLQNLNAFPILDKNQEVFEETEIHFQKDCGSDNICFSNLQLKAAFADEKKPFPSQDGQQVMQFNSSVKRVLLLVNVTNLPAPGRLTEDAHEARLNITVPPALQFSAAHSKELGPGICKMEETLLCELGNPFKANYEAEIQLIFQTSGVSLHTREIECTLQLSTSSKQSDLDPVPVTLLVEYTLLSTFTVDPLFINTEFSGVVMGESAMKTFDDIGSPVEYKMRVRMFSMPLGTLGNLEVDFLWPYEVANGKWLLYPTEILINTVNGSRCTPPGDIVNPLQLSHSERSTRKRRELDGNPGTGTESQAAISVRTRQRKNVRLDCSLGKTVRCVKFSCPLLNMTNTAEVTVRARLWNSTMLEDYEDDHITVEGLASLRLRTDIPTLKMETQTRKFMLYVDPALTEQAVYEAPLWIIIVSVLAGVLLLALIILLLWKCGFFRRASTRELSARAGRGLWGPRCARHAKCGFFKRALYYRIMPKYHGVKIGREERYQLSEGFLTVNPGKKHWVTNWTEIHQHYY
ncbi:hypothetical protein GJAV_G00226560 [Gymnothorax javanicus]|nr:hypothetical protein GJAV_G00226560 [Gymnothorax javanicus]